MFILEKFFFKNRSFLNACVPKIMKYKELQKLLIAHLQHTIILWNMDVRLVHRIILLLLLLLFIVRTRYHWPLTSMVEVDEDTTGKLFLGGSVIAYTSSRSTGVMQNHALIQTKNVSKARPRCTDWKM